MYIFIFFFMIFSITLSPVISICWSILFNSKWKNKKVLKEKAVYRREMLFEVNKFIKMMGMFSMSNNYNLLKSLEASQAYTKGEIKDGVSKLIMDLKMNYSYEDGFNELAKKINTTQTFNNFLSNLLIIKKQSNIDNSAKKMFDMASDQIKLEILYEDRFFNVRENNFKNFLINIILGYVVIFIIMVAMFSYYFEFARSMQGAIINNFMIFSVYFGLSYLIKKTYGGFDEEWKN